MNIRVAVAILIGVVLVVMIIVWIYQRQRTTRLQRQFGPEYDRLLAGHRSRRRVEAELEARCQRVKALHLHELDAAKRRELLGAWESAQARFADDPRGAVAAAARLVEEALEAQGYSVGSVDQCMADLSVHHAYAAEDYRTAREISARAERGGASTEDLRQAMIFYRALFEDVLGERIRKQEAHHERAA
jgi:hypothetical protein